MAEGDTPATQPTTEQSGLMGLLMPLGIGLLATLGIGAATGGVGLLAAIVGGGLFLFTGMPALTKMFSAKTAGLELNSDKDWYAANSKITDAKSVTTQVEIGGAKRNMALVGTEKDGKFTVTHLHVAGENGGWESSKGGKLIAVSGGGAFTVETGKVKIPEAQLTVLKKLAVDGYNNEKQENLLVVKQEKQAEEKPAEKKIPATESLNNVEMVNFSADAFTNQNNLTPLGVVQFRGHEVWRNELVERGETGMTAPLRDITARTLDSTGYIQFDATKIADETFYITGRSQPVAIQVTSNGKPGIVIVSFDGRRVGAEGNFKVEKVYFHGADGAIIGDGVSVSGPSITITKTSDKEAAPYHDEKINSDKYANKWLYSFQPDAVTKILSGMRTDAKIPLLNLPDVASTTVKYAEGAKVAPVEGQENVYKIENTNITVTAEIAEGKVTELKLSDGIATSTLKMGTHYTDKTATFVADKPDGVAEVINAALEKAYGKDTQGMTLTELTTRQKEFANSVAGAVNALTTNPELSERVNKALIDTVKNKDNAYPDADKAFDALKTMAAKDPAKAKERLEEVNAAVAKSLKDDIQKIQDLTKPGDAQKGSLPKALLEELKNQTSDVAGVKADADAAARWAALNKLAVTDPLKAQEAVSKLNAIAAPFIAAASMAFGLGAGGNPLGAAAIIPAAPLNLPPAPAPQGAPSRP